MKISPIRGMVHVPSVHAFADTLARMESVVTAKGIPILARIDHSGDAARAGVRMNPTFLLIFGNAKAGTPLMIASPSVAIDLPLKALIWEDADGQVWVSYNAPEYVAERHALPPSLVPNIEGIRALCEAAAKS